MNRAVVIFSVGFEPDNKLVGGEVTLDRSGSDPAGL
jgi:hypothetical protein